MNAGSIIYLGGGVGTFMDFTKSSIVSISQLNRENICLMKCFTSKQIV